MSILMCVSTVYIHKHEDLFARKGAERSLPIYSGPHSMVSIGPEALPPMVQLHVSLLSCTNPLHTETLCYRDVMSYASLNHQSLTAIFHKERKSERSGW